MTQLPPPKSRRTRSTLLDASLLVVTVAVLALAAVPKLLDSVERERATTACEFLAQVQSAQDRHLQRHGDFGASLGDLGITTPVPSGFTVGDLVTTPGTDAFDLGWSLALTRFTSRDEYQLVWTERGFDAARSSIPTKVNPLTHER